MEDLKTTRQRMVRNGKRDTHAGTYRGEGGIERHTGPQAKFEPVKAETRKEETAIIESYLKRLHVPEQEWEDELAWYRKRANGEGATVVRLLKAAAEAVEELVEDDCVRWV